ncbi:MAG: ferrous iron transport protein A [Robinsoniella sp.]|nr:ferrous iron transport protein A [Robinsoniella sp.]
MTLDLGKKGASYIIEELHLPLQLQKRLEALGMTSGTTISILNSKSRGTLIINVRGTRFAIGRGISKNIKVRDVL